MNADVSAGPCGLVFMQPLRKAPRGTMRQHREARLGQYPTAGTQLLVECRPVLPHPVTHRVCAAVCLRSMRNVSVCRLRSSAKETVCQLLLAAAAYSFHCPLPTVRVSPPPSGNCCECMVSSTQGLIMTHLCAGQGDGATGKQCRGETLRHVRVARVTRQHHVHAPAAPAAPAEHEPAVGCRRARLPEPGGTEAHLLTIAKQSLLEDV